ncbi:peptidase S8/S53 domain-containing protein [Mycena galericulata]|nr:peptidase S8/S53 domain-containing protein [Mycena galericulata]
MRVAGYIALSLSVSVFAIPVLNARNDRRVALGAAAGKQPAKTPVKTTPVKTMPKTTPVKITQVASTTTPVKPTTTPHTTTPLTTSKPPPTTSKAPATSAKAPATTSSYSPSSAPSSHAPSSARSTSATSASSGHSASASSVFSQSSSVSSSSSQSSVSGSASSGLSATGLSSSSASQTASGSISVSSAASSGSSSPSGSGSGLISSSPSTSGSYAPSSSASSASGGLSASGSASATSAVASGSEVSGSASASGASAPASLSGFVSASASASASASDFASISGSASVSASASASASTESASASGSASGSLPASASDSASASPSASASGSASASASPSESGSASASVSASASASASASGLPSGCPPMPTATLAPLPNQIPNRYMVTLTTSADLDSHLTQLQSFISANQNCSMLNNSVSTQIDQSFMKFYAGTFDGRVLGWISGAQGVQTVERAEVMGDPNPNDGPAPGQDFTRREIERRRSGAPWNLARITSNGPLKLSSGGPSDTSQDWTYFIDGNANGASVAIYIVDTGVQATHGELVNRVVSVASTYLVKDVGDNMDDLDGHGTAVASVAAGISVGVANAATIIPMKIMKQYTDLMDDTTTVTEIASDGLVSGIANAIAHYDKVWNANQGAGSAKPAIINISITMWKSTALEQIVKAAVAAGLHVVVASGNNGNGRGKSGADVCSAWISNVGQITVGATNIEDNMSSFSNYGACVDVYGPGESILVANIKGSGSNALTTMDGTSFAAPLVSGLIATIISSSGNLSPSDMKNKILSDATGKVANIANYPKSQNRLALVDPSIVNLMD